MSVIMIMWCNNIKIIEWLNSPERTYQTSDWPNWICCHLRWSFERPGWCRRGGRRWWCRFGPGRFHAGWTVRPATAHQCKRSCNSSRSIAVNVRCSNLIEIQFRFIIREILNFNDQLLLNPGIEIDQKITVPMTGQISKHRRWIHWNWKWRLK